MPNKKTEKLRVIPLGGVNGIGKNITVFEYGPDMIVVDCGLAFPEDNMLGVDLVIPDMSYIESNKDKLRGLFITHGHEDHIGASPISCFLISCSPVWTAGRFAVRSERSPTCL